MIKILGQGLCLLAFGFALGFAPATEAQDAPQSPPITAVNEQQTPKAPVAAELVSEDSTIQPGHPFWVAVHMKMDEHWHAYWKNPGDAGMAPVLTWKLPEGFTAGEVQWTTPKRFTVDNTVGFGYEDEVVLLVEITPPSTIATPQATLAANVRWVVCSDKTCLPGSTPISLDLPVNSAASTKISANSSLFESARSKLPQKHDGIAARHDDELIELSFQDTKNPNRSVKHAEFFPEHEGIVEYNAQPLFEASKESPGKYTLVFDEVNAQSSLKGILVLHTANGTEAYNVDVPVASAGRDEPISRLTSIAARETETKSKATALDTHKDPSYEFQGGVSLAIALAFIGGMILNLMPCVLPVISFKILSFINLAGQQRRLIFKHGLAFSGGVLLSFWIMAALLLGLQAYGRSVGWGFQLQEPLFVAILAAFIFVFGLSLFGMFELGTSVMAKAGEVQHSSGKGNALIGSFMSGVLATAVATPCTGPFLGSTVGYAVTLPPMDAMMIFTAVGLGMSSPYLALAAFPSLLRLLPKPGNWMITFKEIMGFLMMASVIWLIWVFSAQTGTFATSVFLGGLFFLSIACWIYGRWATPMCKKTTRMIGTVGAFLFFAMGSYTILTSTSSWAESMGGATTPSAYAKTEIADAWEEFNPQRITELREQGIPVFVDFTAKWCLICQANHAVLSTGEVVEKFIEKGVVRMKADWTKSDEMIAGELRKFGRNSVPLYIMYGTDKESDPQILPQLLTPEIVIEAINTIEAKL